MTLCISALMERIHLNRVFWFASRKLCTVKYSRTINLMIFSKDGVLPKFACNKRKALSLAFDKNICFQLLKFPVITSYHLLIPSKNTREVHIIVIHLTQTVKWFEGFRWLSVYGKRLSNVKMYCYDLKVMGSNPGQRRTWSM